MLFSHLPLFKALRRKHRGLRSHLPTSWQICTADLESLWKSEVNRADPLWCIEMLTASHLCERLVEPTGPTFSLGCMGRAWWFKLTHHTFLTSIRATWKTILNRVPASNPRVCDWTGPGYCWRFGVFNIFPGNTDAVSQQMHFENHSWTHCGTSSFKYMIGSGPQPVSLWHSPDAPFKA